MREVVVEDVSAVNSVADAAAVDVGSVVGKSEIFTARQKNICQW